MRDSVFDLRYRQNLRARLMMMQRRLGLIHPKYDTSLSPNGEILPDAEANLSGTEGNSTPGRVLHPEVEGINNAEVVYCSAADFAKVLHSLCSNDGKLLEPATVDLMFRRQLNPSASSRLSQRVSIPEIASSLGIQSRAEDTAFDYGLGGILVIDRQSGRRVMRGAASPNIYWWMDHEAGISGIWATQLLPKGDRKCVALAGKFEQSVYQTAHR